MRNFITSTFCLLLGLLGHAAQAQQTKAQKSLDEKYGFREMRFEADTTEFIDLVFVRQDKGVRLYTRIGDVKKIGDAELDEIDYAFYQGKLLSATVQVRGSQNMLALSRVLQEQYGKGTFLPSHSKAAYWESKHVRVVYDENILASTATLTTTSKALAARKEAAEAKAAREVSQGL